MIKRRGALTALRHYGRRCRYAALSNLHHFQLAALPVGVPVVGVEKKLFPTRRAAIEIDSIDPLSVLHLVRWPVTG